MERKRVLVTIPSNIGRSILPAPFCDSLAETMYHLGKDPRYEVEIKYFGGLRVDAVRIQMVYYAKQHHFDYIIMLDDDMIFPSNLLYKLLMHCHVEGRQVISGVYQSKKYPYNAFIYPIESEGWSGKNWLTTYEQKLYEVKTIATGCVCIDMSIFEKLEEPYFLLRMDTKGRITWTEDCYFGMNCFQHKIKMYVDATLQCQHLDLVAFPQFFKSPYVTYGIPEKIDEIHMDEKGDEKGISKIMYPRNPTHLEKDKIIYNDVWSDKHVITTHPKEGLFYEDGIDDCEHDHQLQLPTNAGEPEIFKCMDCGLVVSYDKYLEKLEKVSNDSQSK